MPQRLPPLQMPPQHHLSYQLLLHLCPNVPPTLSISPFFIDMIKQGDMGTLGILWVNLAWARLECMGWS